MKSFAQISVAHGMEMTRLWSKERSELLNLLKKTPIELALAAKVSKATIVQQLV
jgi:hypothetical protein